MFSSTETTTVELSLDRIRIDGGTQPRAALDYGYISDLAQDMLLTDSSLKPVIVYYDGTEYWLADGFHRYHAAKQICRETIEAEVRQGTRRDAVLYSVGANATHGKRRSNDDKRRAVETLLNDPEWIKWSDSEIARRTSTSHTLVGQIRSLTCNIASEGRAYITKHGTTATMHVANIGQASSEQSYVSLTQTEVEALEAQPSPLYGPAYQSPSPVYTPPIPEQLDSHTQSLEQWQQDNRTLGLDKWGDVLSDDEDDIDDEEEEDAPVEDVVPQSVVEPEEKPEERSHFMQIMTSSETPEWYTPEHIVARVIELFGEIDLDPCSNSHEQPSIPAHTHYTKDDDGLSQEWNGKIYMNPPYGTEIAKWTAKLVESHKRGTVEEAIALLPGRIDTSWFQPLYNYLICNIRGRLQFSGAEYSAPFPSVAVYMGDRKEDFKKAFKTLGPIVERVA